MVRLSIDATILSQHGSQFVKPSSSVPTTRSPEDQEQQISKQQAQREQEQKEDQAEQALLVNLTSLLRQPRSTTPSSSSSSPDIIILDLSFYSRETRKFYRGLIRREGTAGKVDAARNAIEANDWEIMLVVFRARVSGVSGIGSGGGGDDGGCRHGTSSDTTSSDTCAGAGAGNGAGDNYTSSENNVTDSDSIDRILGAIKSPEGEALQESCSRAHQDQLGEISTEESILWKRIDKRNRNNVGREDAEGMIVDREVLRAYLRGFEWPDGEGEIFVDVV